MRKEMTKQNGNGHVREYSHHIPVDIRLYDMSAERSILGLLLAEPEHLPRVRAFLMASDFYYEEHRLLYEIIEELFDELGVSWDEVVLQDRIKKKGLDDRFSLDWILDIYQEACPVATLDTACRIVKDYSVQRRCHDLVLKWFFPSLKSGKFTTAEFINKLSKILVETSVVDSEDALSLINKFLNRLASLSQEGELERDIYSTGYASIENTLDGLPIGSYVLIGARPATGKTSFALNLAMSLLKQGRIEPPPTLFVSMEMSETELMKRLSSIISGVPYSAVKNEQLTEEQREQIAGACVAEMDRLKRFYVVHKPGLDVYELEGQIVKHKVEHGVEVVIVDYIQLLRFRGELGVSYEPLSKISQYLATIARKHNVLLIGLVQVGRETTKRGDKRPTLGDLKGSGQLEQDADIVMLLHREGLYKNKPNAEDLKKMEVIIAKNRFGRTGTAELTFFGDTQKIEDVGISSSGVVGDEEEDYGEDEKGEYNGDGRDYNDYDLDF